MAFRRAAHRPAAAVHPVRAVRGCGTSGHRLELWARRGKVGRVPATPSLRTEGAGPERASKTAAAFFQRPYSLKSSRAWEQGRAWRLSQGSLFSTCRGSRGTLGRTAFPLFWDTAATRIRCDLPCSTASFPAKAQGRKRGGVVLQMLQKRRFVWRAPGTGSHAKAEAESTELCLSETDE